MTDEVSVEGAAIVTGGGSSGPGFGTGKAIAVLLARSGRPVVVVDNSESRAQETVDLIVSEGGRATSFVGDVRDSSVARGAVAAAVENYGTLGTLVNNVGVFISGRLSEMTDEAIDLQVDVNLKGMLRFTREAAPALAANGGGSIVNIGSVSAHVNNSSSGIVAYSASKGGVESASRVLAAELGPDNIRVNTVIPGTLNTPLLQATLSQEQIIRRQSIAPLGPGGDAWDVARAVMFLAGPQSGWITGATVPVDGGFLASSAAMFTGDVVTSR